MSRLTRRAFLGAAAVVGAPALQARKKAPPRRNVLLVTVENLRPDLGCYGHSVVRSPHIDALASRGLLFESAYAQEAEAGASSRALLVGTRPAPRSQRSSNAMLPLYFESRGYRARSTESVDEAVTAVNSSIANFFVSLRIKPFAADADRYPAPSVKATKYPQKPQGAPAFAMHDARTVEADEARELIREYYAWVTAVDEQVGRLLAALDSQGLTDSTVVVLAGLHGRHLGDLGLWGAQTNFESATRTPLIVAYPGQRGRGRETPALTELADLYPSICDIAGVGIPSGLEGSSFTPLFEDPDRLWKRAAFSQTPRSIPGIGAGVGLTVRTSRFRYTEWSAIDSPYKSVELYDYRDDPLETANIAAVPRNQSLVNGLAGILAEGWRGSLPPTDPRSGAAS